MPAPPFSRQQLLPRSFLARIMRRESKRNALIELNNAFCDARSVRDVSVALIQDIERKYRIDIRQRFERELLALYRNAFQTYAADQTLTEQEDGDLDHLRRILDLPSSKTDSIHVDVAADVYRSAVQQAVRDGVFTDEERQKLKLLIGGLRLPEQAAQAIFAEEATKVVTSLVDVAVKDERYSEEEET